MNFVPITRYIYAVKTKYVTFYGQDNKSSNIRRIILVGPVFTWVGLGGTKIDNMMKN